MISSQTVTWDLEGEASFKQRAQSLARQWRRQTPAVLLAGLQGPLGAGKTTWVRGMLEGLGYCGRVPSPTYTLLEHYELGDVTLVHVDLYRLPADDSEYRQAGELDAIGVNDWLAQPGAWLLVEWPERSRQLMARCDVRIDIEITGADDRRVILTAGTSVGAAILESLRSDFA